MLKYYVALLSIVASTVYLVAKDPAPSKADQEAAMKAWMESAQPTKPHAELAKLVGEWNCACENHMPDGTVEKSAGTAKRTMIMGGRFLQEEFKGSMFGQPFEGMFLMGYDNNLKRYNTVWIDSMGTGMAMSQGKAETAGVMSTQGTMFCPMQKKEIGVRYLTTIKSNDEEVFEMHTSNPDGKESLMMRITYTRKK